MTQESWTESRGPQTRPDATSGSQVAREQASEVGQSVKDASSHVVHTATEQARQVADEAGRQARDLMHEGREQLREQAGSGQRKAADGLGAVAKELREMAGAANAGGTASELARQGAQRLEQFASWLQDREPGDLVEELRDIARRRPGMFLVAAALAGVVAGRLTSGGVAVARRAKEDTPTGRTSAASPDAASGTATGIEYPTGTQYVSPVAPPAAGQPLPGVTGRDTPETSGQVAQ